MLGDGVGRAVGAFSTRGWLPFEVGRLHDSSAGSTDGWFLSFAL